MIILVLVFKYVIGVELLIRLGLFGGTDLEPAS